MSDSIEFMIDRFREFWTDYEKSGLWKTLSKKERIESKRAAWCAWQTRIKLFNEKADLGT